MTVDNFILQNSDFLERLYDLQPEWKKPSARGLIKTDLGKVVFIVRKTKPSAWRRILKDFESGRRQVAPNTIAVLVAFGNAFTVSDRLAMRPA